MYAYRKSPKPLLDEISNYQPKQPGASGDDPWASLIGSIRNYEDDCHENKLIRALAHGQGICKPYEHDPEFRIKDKIWLRLEHMDKQCTEEIEGRTDEAHSRQFHRRHWRNIGTLCWI